MKVFAISDLHLSVNSAKPMDIFGPVWNGYLDKVFSDWKEKVGEEDIVLLAGDFSWAMKLDNAKADFDLLKSLPGKKIIIRGNHDFWWSAISKVRNSLPHDFYAIQNDALKFNNVVICGTRGWIIPETNKTLSDEDNIIYQREIIRLEMTLKNGSNLRKDGDKLICMIHFPPVNTNLDDSAFSLLFEKYKVDYVIFGHIHSKNRYSNHFNKNGIDYYLTSTDQVDNKLVSIYQN